MRLLCILCCLQTACVRVGFDAALGDSQPGDSQLDHGKLDGSVGESRAGDQGPAGLCAGFSGLLCDDFESNLQQWKVIPTQGTVAISASAAKAGAGGLHVTLTAPGRSVLQKDFTPISSGPIYISAWVRLSASQLIKSFVVMFELRQTPFVGQKISLDGENSNQFQINVTPASVNISSGANKLPRGIWTCMELYVDLGDPGSAWAQVGSTRLDLPNIKTLPPTGGFDQILVGLIADGPTLEADFDDLRIGPQIYGCSGTGP